MIEAIQSIADRRPDDPLKDRLTMQWLRDHGFDLSRPISWWDTPETSARHFRQSDHLP